MEGCAEHMYIANSQCIMVPSIVEYSFNIIINNY